MRITLSTVLALLAVACGPRRIAVKLPRAPSAPRLEAVLGSDGADDYTHARAPHRFEFPVDHGPHSDFRHEWWYFTGHLDAQTWPAVPDSS